MAKILIETYRGWDIEFDTNKETFLAISDSYDTQTTKKSYAAVKKSIDDYIKENATFKPVWVVKNPNSYWGTEKEIKLIGIRRDGLFTYENKEGNKKILSKYSEKDYMIKRTDNEPYLEKLKELNEAYTKYREEFEVKKEKIIGMIFVEGLNTIKEKYTQ